MNSDRTPSLPTSALTLDFSQLSEQIYCKLKEEILRGNLRAGQRLSISALAEMFGVSATPVRDALRQLSADGLLEMQPRKGTFVREFNPRNIQEIFEIRRIIECAAAEKLIQPSNHVEELVAKMEGLASEIQSLQVEDQSLDYSGFSDLDVSFHQCIVDLLDNQQMTEIYKDLRWSVQVIRCLFYTDQQRTDETLLEHDAIVQAFRERNVSRAKTAIREHLNAAEANLLRQMNASLEDEG